MNSRVYSALRKVAADLDDQYIKRLNEEIPLGEDYNYGYKREVLNTGYPTENSEGKLVHLVHLNNPEKKNELDYTHYGPLKNIREDQARKNAGIISGGMNDKYFNIVKYLINYGRAKHRNFFKPENPQPMPKYEGPKLTDDEQKKLKEAKRLQVNNKRSNPYSNIG